MITGRPRRPPGSGFVGLPALPESLAVDLAKNNTLLFRALALMQAIHESKGWVVVENPRDMGDHPSVWLVPPLKEFFDAIGATWVDTHLGAWGASYLKPTTLVGTLPGLRRLALLADPDW